MICSRPRRGRTIPGVGDPGYSRGPLRTRRAAAEYQPGYDGLPGGAQGLRALRMDYDQDYDDDQDFVGFDEAIMRRQHPTPEKQQPCHFHDTHPLSEHADANVDSDVSIPLQLDGVAETSADQ